MLLKPNSVLLSTLRSFKNFGHKPQRPPLITTIWHGFLTFSFIACFIDWPWITDPLGKYYQNAKNKEETNLQSD